MDTYYPWLLMKVVTRHIGLDKSGYRVNIFLISHKNIYCGYSLEASLRGTSNEYLQPMFLWRNKKKYNETLN